MEDRMMWTSRQERIAARALMSDRSPEAKLNFVQQEAELNADRAEALLNYVRKRSNDKKAQLRGMVDIMSGAEEDTARMTLILQGAVALGVFLFAAWLASSGRYFLAAVAGGLGLWNLGMALSVDRRRRAARRNS